MDRKTLFINWVSSNKIKNVTSKQLANIMESAFMSFFNVNIWNIDDEELYRKLKNDLISEKKFKKERKKDWKVIQLYGKYYAIFLKMHNNSSNDNQIESNKDTINKENTDKSDEVIYKEEQEKINKFFHDKNHAEIFYNIFVYSKKQKSNIFLDVRTTIIGVKMNNERLRYYATPNGMIKFANEVGIVELSSLDYDKLCEKIDKVDSFFEQNKEMVMLKKEESNNLKKEYIFHEKFGFGQVLSRKDWHITVNFDMRPSTFLLKDNHPFFSYISKEEYDSKKFITSIDQQKKENDTNMTSKKPAIWNEFETALLIEAFWQSESSSKSETEKIIQNLSDMLRQMAISQGKTIDNKYRNLDGIKMQMINISQAFFPNRYNSERHISTIFERVVNIYKTDKDEFNKILAQAKGMIKARAKANKPVVFSMNKKEKEFYDFVLQKYKEKHKDDGKASNAEIYAQVCINQTKIINQKFDTNLLAISSKKEVEKMINSVNNEKIVDEKQRKQMIYTLKIYYNFLNLSKIAKTPQNDYKKIIEEYFNDSGYAYNNGLQKRKFKTKYSEVYNKEFNDDDKTYLKKITQVGIVCEEKVYPENMVSDEVKQEIKKYIDDCLENQQILSYSVIHNEFTNKIPTIFNEDITTKYLKFVFANEYNFEKEYLSKNDTNIELKEMLIEIFKNNGGPLDKEKIFEKLPSVEPKTIISMLRSKDFIVNKRGSSYFCVESFIIDEDQLSRIENFLNQRIRENDHSSGKELYEFIEKDMQDLVANNHPDITPKGYKEVMNKMLGDKFSFNGDIIGPKDESVGIRELFANFCKERERFNSDELEEFKKDIHCNYVVWDTIFENSVRINEHEFVRNDKIDFNISKIDEAIDKFVASKKFISIKDIYNFLDFPSCGYSWNTYILEIYLYNFSNKYMLCHDSFSKDTPVGGIVKKDNLEIQSFDDLVREIIKENKLFNENDVFEFLLNNQFAKTKKKKNINELIEQVKRGM